MPEAVWKQREIAVLADSIRGESALESRSLGASGVAMHRFIFGEDRMQQALLPHSLEDYVGEENSVRVIEVFIDELDLAALGFSGMTRAATGRPAYHPSTLLKIYLYGYLNRLQSSRCCHRRQQVQSGEQPRQELHGSQGRQADGAGRRQHRALPGGAGPGRPRRE